VSPIPERVHVHQPWLNARGLKSFDRPVTLGVSQGQTWFGFGVVADGKVLSSDVRQAAHRMDDGDRSGMPFVDVVTRRLWAVAQNFRGLLYEFPEVNRVGIWRAPDTQRPVYLQRTGQLMGLMKAICFQEGLPVREVEEAHLVERLGADSTQLPELEAGLRRRLPGVPDLPTYTVYYDDNQPHEAKPVLGLSVAYVASLDA